MAPSLSGYRRKRKPYRGVLGTFIFRMKKLFFFVQLVVVIAFSVWLYNRHQIWQTTDFFPYDMLQIYTRDGLDFFLFFRVAFLGCAAWAVLLSWQTRKLSYIILPFLWYAVLLLADNYWMHSMIVSFRQSHAEITPPLPFRYYRGGTEALLTLFFAFGLVLFSWRSWVWQSRRLEAHL